MIYITLVLYILGMVMTYSSLSLSLLFVTKTNHELKNDFTNTIGKKPVFWSLVIIWPITSFALLLGLKNNRKK